MKIFTDEEDRIIINKWKDCLREEIIEEFKKRGFDRSYSSIERRKDRLMAEGYDLRKSQVYFKKLNSSLKIGKSINVDLKKIKEDELLNELSNRGFISTRERTIQTDNIYSLDFKEKDIVGVVADTHLGSQYQQITSLVQFYKTCENLGISKIFHAGDISDGNGKIYKGQIYEMFLHGSDAQKEYIINNYPNINGITTYLISGNHDYSFYSETGYDICKEIAKERKDINYLGVYGAYIKVGNLDKFIYLMHGEGGIPYADSYRMQHIISDFSPDKKPNILLLGHYHRPCWLPGYRNVEGLQLPCFQSQTPYLKRKGKYPFVGGMTIEFTRNNKGITSFAPKIIPFYNIKQGDY